MLNSFLFLVNTSINPINITKYINNGVITLVIESPALKINWANSGDIFAFIAAGIMFGAKIDHLATDPGSNILDSIENTNINNTKGINEKSDNVIIFDNHPVITNPMFVSVTKALSCAAKNTSTNIPPILFR